MYINVTAYIHDIINVCVCVCTLINYKFNYNLRCLCSIAHQSSENNYKFRHNCIQIKGKRDSLLYFVPLYEVLEAAKILCSNPTAYHKESM